MRDSFQAAPSSKRLARFGAFELDAPLGELRKDGVKVKLQEQPFQILQVLLECPGELVTREALRNRIWPADTFVDFDKSLYSAIKKLREALGDDVDSPRYIETIPKRGYRFVGALDEPGNEAIHAGPVLVIPPPIERDAHLWPTNEKWGRILNIWAVAAVLAVVVAVGLWVRFHNAWRPEPKHELDRQVTAGSQEKASRKLADGWFIKGSNPDGYESGIDRVSLRDGHPSAYLRSKSPRIEGYGAIGQGLLADHYLAKRVRFSAFVKTEGVQNYAGLWLRVDKGKKILVLDNMSERPIKGTTDWKEYDSVVNVAADATDIYFGFLLEGPGTVWVNGLKFEIVGKDVLTTKGPPADKPSNLDFDH